jgi:signal transduction histidine kinase
MAGDGPPAAEAERRAERQRLARDLHDTVSQTLLSLYWTAQAAADLWDVQPAQARAALHTVCDLALSAVVEMRALLLDLHNAALERQGLLPALEALCALVRQRSGVQVELELRGGEAGIAGAGQRLPWAQEEALYYVAREALTNVLKHARATRATVALVRGARVRLVVEDDGVGFGTPPEAFTFGLGGMRARVEALGGRLVLENRAGGGGRVMAELSRAKDTEGAAPPAGAPSERRVVGVE